jgi:peptidoglycan-associated lipoprotein
MVSATRRVAPALIGLAFAALAAACAPKYPKCEKDTHCQEKGEVCVEGTCQQCRGDEQCEAGQQCKGGRCEAKPECAADTDCSGGKICRSGKCELECSAASDCGSGLKCMRNRCVDQLACDGPSDCSSGQNCSGGRCADMTNVGRETDVCSMPTVYFDFNSFTLSRSARDELSAAVECIGRKGGTITIEGHCDERGTEEYNLVLGENRARAVQKYLNGLGVSKSKLRIVSKGELEPADPGHSESAWTKNRRSEFIER